MSLDTRTHRTTSFHQNVHNGSIRLLPWILCHLHMPNNVRRHPKTRKCNPPSQNLQNKDRSPHWCARGHQRDQHPFLRTSSGGRLFSNPGCICNTQSLSQLHATGRISIEPRLCCHRSLCTHLCGCSNRVGCEHHRRYVVAKVGGLRNKVSVECDLHQERARREA